jgi:hypothetical protein
VLAGPWKFPIGCQEHEPSRVTWLCHTQGCALGGEMGPRGPLRNPFLRGPSAGQGVPTAAACSKVSDLGGGRWRTRIVGPTQEIWGPGSN